MKKLLFIFLVVVALGLTQSFSEAGWLIFHKPEFKGRLIDEETKEPIEGAVVVAVYQKYIPVWPAGGHSSTIKVRETLTDKNGEFHFPSYTTIIQPLSWEDYTDFIIYKPGYKSIGQKPLAGMPTNLYEIFFSKGPIGRQGEIRHGDPEKIYKVTFGIVELPRAKTWEERRKSIPGLISYDDFLEEQKLLLQLINEEEANLQLEKSDPFKRSRRK